MSRLLNEQALYLSTFVSDKLPFSLLCCAAFLGVGGCLDVENEMQSPWIYTPKLVVLFHHESSAKWVVLHIVLDSILWASIFVLTTII